MARTRAFDEAAALDRAMNLFWKRGYHATSMQELVDDMGVNRASLYATFGNKRELFDLALARYRDENRAGLRAFLAEQTDVRRGIRAMFSRGIEESIADVDNKGCFMVNATTELASGDDELTALLCSNQIAFEQILYDFMLAGRERGELTDRPDLRVLAGLFYTLYNGIKVLAKIEGDRASLLASVDAALELLDN
ncbi:MAG: helix-turn-helix domain-containing protein [Saprospiraceae bacterium]